MCDRNKQEIMARELCILWWQACTRKYEYPEDDKPLPEYVDQYWEEFIKRADALLELIDNHDD